MAMVSDVHCPAFQLVALLQEIKSMPCLVKVPVLSKKAALTCPAIRILSELEQAICFPASRSNEKPTGMIKAVGRIAAGRDVENAVL